MTSLLNADCRIKVSSVLNRETALYGKQFLTDDSNETCWNSEPGSSQFIVVDFGRMVEITALQLMFQGGFVGKTCQLFVMTEEGKMVETMAFYPEDINPLQICIHFLECLTIISSNKTQRQSTSRIKIFFESSTDFFGRITVYKLDILGHDVLT
ncbi:Nuclear receptor 2C2-associated protein [Mortierella sp. NVP85]|nr:Nuclear receptor 2C2-associated protein [Mortierella sp. NVP85]